MPDWPDFTNLGDFVSPVLQFIGTALFAFGPFIALNSFAPPDAAWRLGAIVAAIIFGGLYFPMAFLAVTMADSLSALNPLIIIPAILKIPAAYLLMVILTVAIVGAGSFGELLLGRSLPVPILPGLISEFLTSYLGPWRCGCWACCIGRKRKTWPGSIGELHALVMARNAPTSSGRGRLIRLQGSNERQRNGAGKLRG